MKTQYLNLIRKSSEMSGVQATISLNPFISFVKDKIKVEKGIKQIYYVELMERIQEFKNWENPIRIDEIEKFHDLFELVFFSLTRPVTEGEGYFLALGNPLASCIFSGTEAFYDLLTDDSGKLRANVIDREGTLSKQLSPTDVIYALAINKLYHFPLLSSNETNISIKDEETGLDAYYRITFDIRFVDISTTCTLPEIDFSNYQFIQSSMKDAIRDLQSKLPLSKLHFDGFTIVRMDNVTAEYAIETIKDSIANLASDQKMLGGVIHAIRLLLNFGQDYLNLIPMFKVNDELVEESLDEVDDSFWHECNCKGFSKEKYLQLVKTFVQNPGLVLVRDTSKINVRNGEMQSILESMEVRAFASIPLYFQKQLVGLLQIFSMRPSGLPFELLPKLNRVITLLEQFLEANIQIFNSAIDHSIKNNFTALQPSILWRFNEAAWGFIRKNKKGKDGAMEHIHFPNVYPLYGAVDIRNSTQERNDALRADMDIQLGMLVDLFHRLKDCREMSLIDEILFKTESWRSRISEYIVPEDEFRLYLFLEQDVSPILSVARESGKEMSSLVDDYLKAKEPQGKAFKNRMELESSFQQINRVIATELEKMNSSIQQIYPCYFDKYRSDGLEYDIYIGQSISPHNQFYPFHLSNLRLVQLTSMAEITKKTNELLPHLPKPLETTQLIFINNHVIDITFRNDERRFDVEGGYNVRYEMIKKRIDKVHILGSVERLTQPGKIALVYLQQEGIEDYLSHIQFLQEKGILLDDKEMLELEPLQGLNGLKALRVGVKL